MLNKLRCSAARASAASSVSHLLRVRASLAGLEPAAGLFGPRDARHVGLQLSDQGCPHRHLRNKPPAVQAYLNGLRDLIMLCVRALPEVRRRHVRRRRHIGCLAERRRGPLACLPLCLVDPLRIVLHRANRSQLFAKVGLGRRVASSASRRKAAARTHEMVRHLLLLVAVVVIDVVQDVVQRVAGVHRHDYAWIPL